MFDIILNHFVSKEEFETREKNLASSMSVGANEVLYKYFNEGDSISHTSGNTNSVEDDNVATDEEVGDVLDDYFN